MGVIKPPWISQEWFEKCPLNYCDHFGDKLELALICKICREDLKRNELYKKAGEDPYDITNVLRDVGDDFKRVLSLLQEDAEKFGIDFESLPLMEEEPAPDPESYTIYKLMYAYGDIVEKLLSYFQMSTPRPTPMVTKVMAVLGHSRHYVIVKTARALTSRWEEQNNPEDELLDSKTSAFLAYIAVQRNAHAVAAYAALLKSDELKKTFHDFVQISVRVLTVLQDEFFRDDILTYKELGCDSYNEHFRTTIRATLIPHA